MTRNADIDTRTLNRAAKAKQAADAYDERNAGTMDTTQVTPDTCDDCYINPKTGGFIVLCPLHAAAPDLLAALEAVSLILDGYVHDGARADWALAKIEKEADTVWDAIKKARA